MGRRRSPTPLLVILAVLLAALPHLAESSGRHHHGHGHRSKLQSRGYGGGEGDEQQAPAAKERETRQWPCCDNCGSCTKSIPPQCQCLDAVRGGCHPACRDCVKSALSVHPPVYQCMDRIPNFCQQRCNPVAAHWPDQPAERPTHLPPAARHRRRDESYRS